MTSQPTIRAPMIFEPPRLHRLLSAARGMLCQACRSPQVQVVDWQRSPALWKCRDCGKAWSWEVAA